MESSVFPMQIMLVCPQHVFINTLTTQWVNKGVPSLVQLSLRVDSCEHAASLMIFMKVNVSLHWFKLIYLRSIAKQVIPLLILITLNHPFRMVSISFLNEVWEERKARPVLKCWAPSKEASCTIFKTSLVWLGRGSNPRPPAHGVNALTTEPLLRSPFSLHCSTWQFLFNIKSKAVTDLHGSDCFSPLQHLTILVQY